MNPTIKYHPLLIALICSLPYLLLCEALFFWIISGSKIGFLIGSILLGVLVMPKIILFGYAYGYPIEGHAALYLGCESEPILKDINLGIGWQYEIFSSFATLFFFIFLTTYIIFIVTSLPSLVGTHNRAP